MIHFLCSQESAARAISRKESQTFISRVVNILNLNDLCIYFYDIFKFTPFKTGLQSFMDLLLRM